MSFGRDFLASLVVFLVALPLCLGIAIACGVPPALGLISGIIGGVVIGTFSGVPLQVSGPAAGLTVLVTDFVGRHGLAALGAVLVLAGLIQIAAGFLKLGRWFRAVSPAVMHGMLSGIGLLIIFSQLHVMFDEKPHSDGLENILLLKETIGHVFGTAINNQLWAVVVASQTLIVLVLWKFFKLDRRLYVPAALPAIGLAVLSSALLNLPVKYVDIPDNFASSISLPTLDSFYGLGNHEILLAAVAFALIASAETLLSAGAVDQMHNGPRGNNDRELIAQGVGNVTAGFLGGLPMTGVIARSTVNVEAGAASRFSTILHGLWLLLVVMLVPFALEFIPTSSLAALLVFTGFKLIDTSVIARLKAFGARELGVYLTTVAAVVATDLLTGVLVGFVLALANLVLTIAKLKAVLRREAGDQCCLVLAGAATLLGLPQLSEVLSEVPQKAMVRLDFSGLVFIDHACLDLLRAFEKRHTAGGGVVKVDWALLENLKSPAQKANAAAN